VSKKFQNEFRLENKLLQKKMI